jgi:uncharacterized membrane protein
MPSMEILPITLFLATCLCFLVAGFLFAFAVVVMPGIRRLEDREFLRAFQVMDGVIQASQPGFLFVWIGSVVAVLVTAALSIGQLGATERLLVVVATLAYLLCVQLPTVIVNVPLNNKLQTLDLEGMNAGECGVVRGEFETRWNQWNVFRTAFAILASALFAIVPFLL